MAEQRLTVELNAELAEFLDDHGICRNRDVIAILRTVAYQEATLAWADQTPHVDVQFVRKLFCRAVREARVKMV